MNTHADKIQKPESKSVATHKKQKNGPATFQLMDKRSEAVTQRKLQTMANESNQVSQLRSLQEKTYQSSLEEKNAIQKKPNNTGLPDNLKTGIENLSGYSMDDVKVHYNSAKPAQLNAHAYAQGTNIHLASGQEKHLPHEAWHVVQQKQGRVQPTMQLKGKVNINDDKGLEKEADEMGAKAIQLLVNTKSAMNFKNSRLSQSQVSDSNSKIIFDVIQGVFVYSFLSHRIKNSDKNDKYYEDIGFIRVINPLGGFVWADRRNVECVKELLGYSPDITNNEMSEIRAFTISAPTHDKGWQSKTQYNNRINCIREALKIIYSVYDASKLYILTAPEYFFAAPSKDSHFMDKKEFDYISSQLQSIASSLPPNLVMVPGTIGYSEVITKEELESEVAKLQIKHDQLLNYVSSYRDVEKNEKNIALYTREYVKKEYEFDWEYETKQLKDKSSTKKLFNRALVFYNQTMEVYDKMFESVSGERDRGKGDDGKLFEHGTAPFVREYKGIKIALQVCSDYAYESLRGLDIKPDIQLVPASNYGGAESFQQAKTLLKADSKGSSVTKMVKEGKKQVQEQDHEWELNSLEKTTLSYYSIKK
ncbi:hypothetical protein FVB9532_00454 [Mesonia oceanica]|uniref:Uncharacterized protein n=2 Tax=Flavobacteriaceae TaxID=49546 RepID=A0AC61Y550_9FLAO|nr:hypothetical protein FVB9532_00454 [Mesonia oceanica]|tara:strand:- start:39736 stop:41505 length:1770 start_codon:yes stop_codon:yes gene_type:complete